jgi:hypothetical protein
MNPLNRIKVLSLPLLGLIVLLAVGVYLWRDQPLDSSTSRQTSTTTKLSKLSAGPAAQSHKQTTPKPSSSASRNSSQTTVTTSGNCTKTVSSKTTKTASGTQTVSSTSVKCSGQGQNGSTNVNINSANDQTSTPGNSSGTSGSATNSDQENVEINN